MKHICSVYRYTVQLVIKQNQMTCLHLYSFTHYPNTYLKLNRQQKYFAMHILLMKLSSIGWNETIFNETKNQIMHPRHQFECCGHICNDQYYYQAILLLKQNRYSFVFIEAFRNVSCTTPSESIRATSILSVHTVFYWKHSIPNGRNDYYRKILP